MNKEQGLGLVRTLASFGGGWLAGRGYITTADIGPYTDLIVQLVGAAVALGAGAWSIWEKTKANKIAQAAAVPGVQAIVVSSQAVADAAPANVVTPTDIAVGKVADPGTTKLY